MPKSGFKPGKPKFEPKPDRSQVLYRLGFHYSDLGQVAVWAPGPGLNPGSDLNPKKPYGFIGGLYYMMGT